MKQKRTDTRPWYREPWPWFLMAGPLIVVVAGFVTAWLAFSSNDGLVEDDYYKQGLAVAQRVERDQKAAGMGLGADLMLGSGSEVRLFLTAKESMSFPERLTLHIVHPTRAGHDQHLTMQRGDAGYYVARLAAPLGGRWHVQLEDEARRWRLAAEWNVDTQPALRMQAAATLN